MMQYSGMSWNFL